MNPRYGNVRRSRRRRVCDGDGCATSIEAGAPYFAALGEPGDMGPHLGWWYFCLECAQRRGYMARVITPPEIGRQYGGQS